MSAINKKKILYVCRLFNGLETSVKSRKWNPTGVPTIYKIIETLDSSDLYDLDLLIVSKNNQTNMKFGLVNKIKILGLSSIVTVLYSFSIKHKKTHTIVQELFHILFIFFKVLFGKYDLIYIDHANIFSAVIISRMRDIPVIFRIMGVYPAMRDAMSNYGIKAFLRYCYRSPFDAVICTQDGSGVEPWLNVAINKNTKVHTLINGVDACKSTNGDTQILYDKYNIPRDKLIILYIGKIEIIKGIYEFIEGFSIANKNLEGRLHAVIIGHGNQYNYVLSSPYNDASVTMIPRVSHSEICLFHGISDIYISPNRLANLTNANLEAMISGACIVIPESQPETSVDLITDKLLNNDSVYRVPFPPTATNISNSIIVLSSEPKIRESLSKNVVKQSSQFVTSWDERIKYELQIIESYFK